MMAFAYTLIVLLGLTSVLLTMLIPSQLGLIPWYLTHDPTISVITVVSIDLIAFVPTLRKTWAHPTTERPALYEANILRHSLTLAILGAYNTATMLHSVTMIAVNALMVLFIVRKAASLRAL